VRGVYEAYPNQELVVNFEEAVSGLIATNDIDTALSLLDFARRRLGPDHEKLAEAAAQISQRFADSGTVDDALRIREAVGAYPGSAHVDPVKNGMETLVDAERHIDALALYAHLRARLPSGDPTLAEQALIVFEAIGSDPETRGRGFDVLATVENDLTTLPDARIRWLIELGDIACLVGGKPKRAEATYQEAAGASRPSAAIASARLAILADTSAQRDEAMAYWTELGEREIAPAGIVLAAKVVLGKEPPEALTAWQAQHPAEMSGAELVLFLGLRALHEGRYEDYNKALRRARELVTNRKWPYHLLVGRLDL
jgi:hypothetical protein